MEGQASQSPVRGRMNDLSMAEIKAILEQEYPKIDGKIASIVKMAEQLAELVSLACESRLRFAASQVLRRDLDRRYLGLEGGQRSFRTLSSDIVVLRFAIYAHRCCFTSSGTPDFHADPSF